MDDTELTLTKRDRKNSLVPGRRRKDDSLMRSVGIVTVTVPELGISTRLASTPSATAC